MIRPVMLIPSYNKRPLPECKKPNIVSANNNFRAQNPTQVAFSGSISDAFKIWKVCKKLPEGTIDRYLYRRLTMPKDLLNHNWEIVQAHKEYLQTINSALKTTEQNNGFCPELDKKVARVLNAENFDPYFKVKIPTSQEPVNLIDVFLGRNKFSKEQNFPADVLMKIYGSDAPVPAEAYEKMSHSYGGVLSSDIMDNFRFRFMKTDIKKENPAMYKQILNLYQKCLDNRHDYNTMTEGRFANSINSAAKAHNKNYLEMITDLKIGDDETFECQSFDKILKFAAEDVCPTDVETIRNSAWWDIPNPKADRAKIHNFYLGKK